MKAVDIQCILGQQKERGLPTCSFIPVLRVPWFQQAIRAKVARTKNKLDLANEELANIEFNLNAYVDMHHPTHADVRPAAPSRRLHLRAPL